MADAQAVFVATMDSSQLQASAKSSLTALQRMGMEIQKRSKDLAALKAAQSRLAQSAGVQEYLKRQKAIEKNEAYAKRVEERVTKAQEKLDAAKSGGSSEETIAKLSAEAQKAQEALAKVNTELEELRGKQDELSKTDTSVQAYKDQGKVIKDSEKELADLQTQYSAAGGSATDLADKIEEPKQGITSLAEEAKKVGGPIGKLGGILEKLGGVKMAGPLALVAVLIAIAAAAIKAGIALAKFALISADAARNSARARSAAAFGSMAGTAEIDGAMKALRENTALSKQEAQGLAIELYRAGERGKQLENTAVTIARFGQLGEDAQSAVKGLYEELRKPVPAVGVAGGVAKSMMITPDMLPRDVFLKVANKLGQDARAKLGQGFTADKGDIRRALEEIGEQGLGDSALEQMRSLDKLSERLSENLQGLFASLKVGVLLGALQKIVGLLDETSDSGKAIREVLGQLAQPFADAVEAALPYIEAFFGGIIAGGIYVAAAVLMVYNALADIIPDSFTKNIDWIQVVLYGTIGLMLALAITSAACALAFLVLLSPILLLIAALVAFNILTLMAIDYVIGLWDELMEVTKGQDFSTVAKDILAGLIQGLKDGAADLFKAFTDLAKGGYDAFKNAILSKSPSRLFRLAGRTIPQGTALGIEDETPKVENAAANMVGPEDMGGAGSGGKRSGGGIQFVVQAGAVVIQVQSADEIQSEGFMRQLGQALVSAAREGGLSTEPEPA